MISVRFLLSIFCLAFLAVTVLSEESDKSIAGGRIELARQLDSNSAIEDDDDDLEDEEDDEDDEDDDEDEDACL